MRRYIIFTAICALLWMPIKAFGGALVVLDSTTANIGTSSTYTGTRTNTYKYDELVGMIYTDQECTLYIDQSVDRGSNWDYTYSIGASAVSGTVFKIDTYGKHARMRITTTGTATSELRAYMYGRNWRVGR